MADERRAYILTEQDAQEIAELKRRVRSLVRPRQGPQYIGEGWGTDQPHNWVIVTGPNTPEVQTVTVNATGGYWLVKGAVEVQTITLQAKAGTWLIGGCGTPLAYNETLANVQAAARTATGALVTVTGTAGASYVITWPDDASHTLLTVDGTKLTGSVSIERTDGGLAGSATHIAWNAAASAVQTVVQAVTGLTVTVTGSAGGPYTMTWPANGGPQPLLVLDGSNLTGGAGTASIAETSAGTNGRYPGQWGLDDEQSTNPGTITAQGNPGDVWVREANGDALDTDTWYWGRLESNASDGIAVYVVGLTPGSGGSSFVQINSLTLTSGRYPGQLGVDSETTDPGTLSLSGSSGDIWVKEVNGAALATGVWYEAVFVGLRATDSKPVYAAQLPRAAGSNTQVQYNDGGAFGADAGMVYDKAFNVFQIVGQVSTGGKLSVTTFAGVLGQLGGTVSTNPVAGYFADNVNTVAVCEQGGGNTYAINAGDAASSLSFQACGTGGAYNFGAAVTGGMYADQYGTIAGTLGVSGTTVEGDTISVGIVTGIGVSDGRLKTQQTPLGSVLAQLLTLHPVRHTWDRDLCALAGGVAHDDRTHIGLIAQEVAAAFPEAAQTALTVDGVALASYSVPAMVAVLVAAVQELTARVTALEKPKP